MKKSHKTQRTPIIKLCILTLTAAVIITAVAITASLSDSTRQPAESDTWSATESTYITETATSVAVSDVTHSVLPGKSTADTGVTTDTISLGDIDNNGMQDAIIAEGAAAKGPLWEDEYNLRWTLMLNDAPVYIGYNRLMCSFKAECIDIDDDGENEIFIMVSPRVNSMPLEEYVVLKKESAGEGDEWKELQNTSADGTNAFPIRGYAGKESPAIIDIICEGFDNVEVIRADTTRHYQEILDKYKDNKGFELMYKYADAVLNGEKYSPGEQVAQTTPWGIHKLRTDNIDGHACIVATHGFGSIEGGRYDDFGNIDIYFNYDAEGRIHVLKMSMRPYDGVDVE